jgi:polysaccharide pyruvyl transferase WcaK-like protein
VNANFGRITSALDIWRAKLGCHFEVAARDLCREVKTMVASRRWMLKTAAVAGVTAAARGANKAPVILLRSGWQTVNIGDIAHTPGVLTVIERNIPNARVILWPGRPLDLGAEPMLKRRFPKLQVLATEGADSPELADAFKTADLLMHGSAAGVGSQAQLALWRDRTKKPYGCFGVGFAPAGEAASSRNSPLLQQLLSDASFVYTRERASLANLKKVGIKGPDMDFAPDGTFSMDLLDNTRADAFLRENRLLPKQFIAVIPRLRYTPYHKFRKTEWSAEEIQRREKANEKHAETDHAKLRDVVTAWVAKTGYKALLCPEMTYQLDIIDPLLYRPLAPEVQKNVVRRMRYWLPDEAASVYRQAVAVISFECHSPIIAAGQGTPCMYVHQPEDGIKGNMWPDLGLGDWYFEVEQTGGAQIAQRLFEMHSDYQAAERKVRDAVKRARSLQDGAMQKVARLLA